MKFLVLFLFSQVFAMNFCAAIPFRGHRDGNGIGFRFARHVDGKKVLSRVVCWNRVRLRHGEKSIDGTCMFMDASAEEEGWYLMRDVG